jgi:hypothetical protein
LSWTSAESDAESGASTAGFAGWSFPLS